jgi:hypothetical protein
VVHLYPVFRQLPLGKHYVLRAWKRTRVPLHPSHALPEPMSTSATQLGCAVSRAAALRASKTTERRVRACHVTRCKASDGAADVSRREALRAAAAAAVLTLATPRSAFAGDNVVAFDPVQNERWVAVPASTKIPGDWTSRPGQRSEARQVHAVHGHVRPELQIHHSLPKYVDADGAVAANAIQLAGAEPGADRTPSRTSAQSPASTPPRRSASRPKTSRSRSTVSASQARGRLEAGLLRVGARPAPRARTF